jgi:hypothetical protein
MTLKNTCLDKSKLVQHMNIHKLLHVPAPRCHHQNTANHHYDEF